MRLTSLTLAHFEIIDGVKSAIRDQLFNISLSSKPINDARIVQAALERPLQAPIEIGGFLRRWLALGHVRGGHLVCSKTLSDLQLGILHAQFHRNPSERDQRPDAVSVAN